MSFTNNFLKALQEKGVSTTNIAGGTTPSASSKNDSSGSNGNNYTSNFLSALQKQKNMTISERADAKAQALLKKQQEERRTPAGILRNYGQNHSGPTTSGGYYSRPELGSYSERLYGNITALEPVLTEKRAALDTAQTSLVQAETDLKTVQGYLQQARAVYDADPTNENATSYNQIVGAYNLAYDAYASAFKTYSTAYDAYKPYEDQLIDALAVYQLYSNQQQAAFDNWRDTIRETSAIETEMLELDAQIGQTEQEITNLKRLTRGRSDAFGQHMRESLQEAETRLQTMQQAKTLLQEEYDWSRYYQYNDLMQAADFAEKSRYATTANGLEPVLNNLSGMYTETGFDDLTYDYINRNQDAKGKVMVNDISSNASFLGVDQSRLEQMTDDEIAIFNYLYATQGQDAAYAYTAYLSSDLNKRQRVQQQEYWTNFAKESPVGSSVFSVMMAPMKGLSYIGQIADIAADGSIDQNAVYNKFSYIPSSIRGQVTQQIEASGKWGKVGSFAYQTGMSMADFLLNTAITGGNQTLSLAIMGTGAAADTTIAAKDRGLDDWQAFTLGTVAGLAEVITEKVSLETLLNPRMLKDGTLKYVLKNMLAEGGEEVGSDLINLFADILVAKDQSEWQVSIDNYMKQGMSEAEAVGRAVADQAATLGLDFLGGVISGGLMSGGNAAIQNRNTARIGDELGRINLSDEDIQMFIEEGLESDPETEAYAIAKELQEKIDAGKELSNNDLARIYQANVQVQPDAGFEEDATEENADPDEAMRDEGEPEWVSLPTLDDDTGGGEVSAETMRRQAQTDYRAGKITEAEFDTIMDDVMHLEELEDGTSVKTFDTQSGINAQTDNINTNVNGGAQYGNEQLQGLQPGAALGDRTAGPAAAQSTGEHYTPGGNGLLPGSSQRYDGTSSAEQAGSLAGRTGQATARNQARVDAARASVQRTNLGKSLRLEKVSSIDLGLQTGTDAKRVQIIPQEYWDASMSAKAEQVRQETGKPVSYILGGIEFRDARGSVSTAKGVITGDGIIVQANHSAYTPEQIADHESYHGMRDVYGQRLNDQIAERIREEFSREEFDHVLDKYIEALSGIYDLNGARDGAEYEQRMNGIIEELLADAHAGMNMWGAGATKFTDTVNRFLDDNNISRKSEQDNGTEEPTGPPAVERFSSAEPSGLSLPTLDEDSGGDYRGRSLTDDPEIYTYDFLTAQPPMKPVELPSVAEVRDTRGRIDTARVTTEGMKNALSVGSERDGRTYVKNRYTGRELWVTTAAIRHGLNGAANRMITNARLGSVIGEIVQNAIPINALHNTSDGVDGTYAMAGYAFDQQGREFVAIVTVEQRTNTVADITAYDMTHAISGRQKRGKPEGNNPTELASEGGIQADTKSQGFNLIKGSSEISIADMLVNVKEVYQSILSEDVLAHMGESRNPKGHYTGRVRYSYAGENANNADLDALARAKEMQAAGVADETIRQQTGWHTGMDGKWRWEIDDSRMEYTSRGDLGLRERRPEYARYRELLDKSNRYVLELSDEALTAEETAELQKLKDIWGGTFRKAGRITEDALPADLLSDYVKHDDLFEAYPQLRKTRLRFADLPEGTRGQYDPEQDIITLSNKLRGKPQDTLVHEIQHVIQKAEGFAGGASVEYWKQQRADIVETIAAARQNLDMWLDDIGYKEAQRESLLAASRREKTMEQHRKDMAEFKANSKYARQIAACEAELAEFQRQYDEITHGMTAYEQYENTAGEIEARDAASRRQMTAEQRRTTEPARADDRTVFVEDIDDAAFAELDAQYGPQLQSAAEFDQDTISSNIQQVAQMEPVTSISGQEFAKGEVDLITQVETFFNQRGNRAYSPELGEVILDRRGVKSDIAHGIGRKKAAAFAAVPDVIEYGLVVDYQKDWKGRGYDTAVVAAPITIGDQTHAAAVILLRSDQTNRFYVHEVLAMENGALPFKTGTREGYPGGDAPSILSILDKIRSVKNETATQERFSLDDTSTQQSQEQKPAAAPKKKIRPVAESRPLIAKKDLRSTVLNLFSIPNGQRAEVGAMIDSYADRLIKNGSLTEDDRKAFFDRMYDAGVMVMPADEYSAYARSHIEDGRIYVSDSVKADFGDDWADIRRRAFAAGVYLVNDRSASGIDQWNATLSAEDMLPGLFDSEETDERTILERILQVAEEGKDEHLSLAEYTRRLSQQEGISEDEFLDNMERQLDWALRTFAEKARLEVHLRDRTGRKIAQEREKGAERMTRQRAKEAQRRADERQARKDSARRAKERRELRELQQHTLKQLQWLSKNRNRAPEELQATWDEVLGDIDLYAISAADEMRWSDKHNATWRDLAQMYKDAMKNDPNFLPSKELERIVTRLDATKIADMDLGALQDLYKAAIGLRTEFYNRNNVINDEMQRLFAEVYTDAKREIESAPGGFTGGVADKFLNLDQLTPMNVLQRMAGWDPDGAFYSMAKQLERGERDMRAYSVKAQKMLQDFLTEHEDWVKKADGQGKDAIWYEVEVPQLLELGMGDKPIFGPTVKVYMTPAQKVHMYLESKNLDNLRHMTGGRTFVNKDLYSQGKRQEALSQGRTIKLAPETVRKLVSDLTPEEMELAQILDRYYNTFATQEINKVSNILYGYDKAMGKNYAPIYTNRNYTKTEFGVFDTTAEGVGNLKGRQYAVNPSYNISAFDAFERHVDQTARFVGMAIPARNWTTLMNWREKNNSTGDVITHKWGEESKKYITDLITTLQGGDDAKSDTVSSGLSKLQSNYISAIFGANPSIVLKQLGSIPLAAAYLDARNVPTPAQIAGIDRSLISKYTQDLEWRTMGYSMPETKQLKDNPNWTQTNKFFRFTFGGGAITAMDGWAASVLWPWAENKVRREFPELEVGTRAQVNNGESPFYKKVAEEFEDALARSQSTSDEIHQGRLRKSKNPITRAFTMFRSDSAQTYNTLRQKIGEAQYYARTGAKPKVLKMAKKAAGAAFVAMLLNALWSESVNFLMALWKNKGKYYRDDEDELTFESVAGEMASGMVGSFAGTVTGGEELLELIGNIITGDTWYGIETPGMEQLNDLLETILESGGGMRDLITDAADILKNGGDLGDYFSKHSGDILGNIKDVAEAAAMYLPGLPASNLEAYLVGALKWISPELGAAYDDLFSDTGKSDLAGMEGSALEGRIGRILSDRNVSESDDTAAALAALYEAGYKTAIPSDTPASVSINGEKQSLGAYQQQAYDTIWGGIVADALDDMVASDSFTTADSKTQAKMLSNLYTYAAERAKAELFDEYEMDSGAAENASIVAAGATVAECITWNTITSEMKSGEKSAELASWDIPESAKREIFLNKISDSREDSITAFLGAGLSFDQFLQAYSKYGEINNMDLKAGMKAVEFSHWVNDQGYSAEQAAIIKDELTYFNMTPASSSRYDELVGSGMDPDDAYDLTGALNELQPEDGEDEVSDLQKWRASVDFSDDVDDQLAALSAVMTDAQFQKVEIANDFGVSPDAYVTLQEIKPQYDADGNGSYKNAEIQAAIDGMSGYYTTEQKAVLWQLATGSTSSRNNPYSRQVGQQVLDARAAAKEAAAQEQTEAPTDSTDDDSFSQALLDQLLGRG